MNRVSCVGFVAVLGLLCSLAGNSQSTGPGILFPSYLQDSFDYASFVRFDAPAPPKTLIYQSNGFLALQERGFGGQGVVIPVRGDPTPTNISDRLAAFEIGVPSFTGADGVTHTMDDATGEHSVSYYADRTVYHFAIDGNLRVSLTVYPVYGLPSAVCRVRVEHSTGVVRLRWSLRAEGLQVVARRNETTLAFGASQWPYRVLVAPGLNGVLSGSGFDWQLRQGQSAALLLAVGDTENTAAVILNALRKSPDFLEGETHRRWNAYLASVPLVAPADPVAFRIGTTGERQTIAPDELVRSELWFWRGALTNTCQARYLPASPMTIADWNVFFGMWGNDGVEEAVALAGTGQHEFARAALLNWFRYAVNATGDGHAAWTIFPSGYTTYAAKGPEHETESVNLQASLVGEYIRLTGDKSILDERLGGPAANRTLWEALKAYQDNLLKVRNTHGGPFIEWLHTYETGWDNKDSPFVDLKGHATVAINEQVFDMWSLSEMSYLAQLHNEDPTPWQDAFKRTLRAVRSSLWDAPTERYWDLDASMGKLWTEGENLDAYYLLYDEKDPKRIEAMMPRLNDPAKFNSALLPTLSLDTPHWGGYWRGPAWPREFGYVAMGLSRAGYGQEGYEWLVRAIHSNLGPLLPENVDPKQYPPSQHTIGPVRIMGYDALDAFLLPEVIGLHTWGGQDLTVDLPVVSGKVYIRGQKWMGDRYDARMEMGKSTLLWRNGQLKGEEIPRICRGGSSSLTFTGVHPRNSKREPTKAHVKEKLDGPTGKSKPLGMGVQIPRGIYPEMPPQGAV